MRTLLPRTRSDSPGTAQGGFVGCGLYPGSPLGLNGGMVDHRGALDDGTQRGRFLAASRCVYRERVQPGWRDPHGVFPTIPGENEPTLAHSQLPVVLWSIFQPPVDHSYRPSLIHRCIFPCRMPLRTPGRVDSQPKLRSCFSCNSKIENVSAPLKHDFRTFEPQKWGISFTFYIK